MPEPKNVIGGERPDYRHNWDCQCARCGSSMVWKQCDVCDDGYDGHDCGEDCCVCLDPEPNVVCDVCRGRGGWWACLSSVDWCRANPKPGREKILHSTPEWFVVEEADHA